MENKYYTPDISEFHVGFEYYYCSAYQEGVSATEIVIDGIDGFEPRIFNFDIWRYNKNKGESWKELFESMLNNNQIKVKYLEREDIESLGFKRTTLDVYRKEINFYRGRVNLYVDVIQRETILICIGDSETPYSDWNTIFTGYIKNKSELRVLLNQLGINEEVR